MKQWLSRWQQGGSGSSLRRGSIAFLLCLAACLVLHLRLETFSSEFGRYGDEGMHFVSALLIHDYVAEGMPGHPIRYAEQYYLHFPKIGLGNWPPVFAMLQAGWMFVAGTSRIASMWLMVILMAALAAVVARMLHGRGVPGILAAAAAGLLILTPLSQAQTAMTMAEIPLALFSLLAIERLARWATTNRWRDAGWFVFWTVTAIFTKGNAWVIGLTAPLLLLWLGPLPFLRRPQTWAIAAAVALPTIPYTLLTMSVVTNGWNSRSLPTADYILAAIGMHTALAVGILGWLMAGVALLGLGSALAARGRLQLAAKEPFWFAMAIYAAAILLFHSVLPTSIEARKIYQIAPVLALFTGAGMDQIRVWIAGRFPRLPAATGAAAVAAATLAVYLAASFTLVPVYRPGFRAAVDQLLARADRKDAAVLVSSNPFSSDSEAAVIAEWASRDRASGTYLARGTKLFLQPVAQGPDNGGYQLRLATVDEVHQILSEVPVSYVLLHDTPSPRSFPHQELLRQAVQAEGAPWERIYEATGEFEGPHRIAIYRSRLDWQGRPVRLSVDLSNKIGRPVQTEP